MTVPGGRGGSVGVGGFIAGGGNSFHSGSHGFACDQVQNFEIVLANGSVVDANGNENRDLWQALKGGSGNLGLITRFDMYAIEFEDPSTPEIWGGVVGYEHESSEGIIDAFVDFVDNVSNDIYSSNIMSWGYNPAAGGFSIRLVCNNVANEAYPPAFDKFFSVPGQTSSSLRSATMSNLTTELIRPLRTYTIWFTGTYKNDPRILTYISDRHDELMLEIESIIGTESGMFSSCQAQPMTQAMISRGRGNNVLGLEERVKDGPGFMFLMYFGVGDAEHEKIAFPYVEAFYKDIEEYATSLDGNWDWYYLNYAHGSQDPVSGYGSEAVGKLRRASEKYDPNGVFQNLRQSGFKIPQ